MTIHIITLFPEFFDSVLKASILKRAQVKNLVNFELIKLRDFTDDERQTTDDRPFGGGPGMILKVEPIARAIDALITQYERAQMHIVLTSAKGRAFTQPLAIEYSQVEHLVIICGHYGGVDQRVVEHLIDEEVRVGDFVLTGGEAATVVMVDAISRLVPGVLGNQESYQDESHSVTGRGEHPLYTRPEEFRGWKVPAVLLSGNHQKIKDWRKQQQTKL